MASSSKIKAGEAYVEATLNDGPLKRKMRETRQFFERRFPRATKVATKAVQGFAKASAVAMTVATGGVAALAAGVAALGTVVTGGVVLGLKKLVDASDQLADSVSRTGTDTTSLQELQYAAEKTGGSVEGMNGALYRMRRRVANATEGTGPAVRALRELGLSAEELSAMSPDRQMMVIADAMKGVADESLAAQYAFEIFGDGAKSLMPLLSEGADGIAKLRQEANDLGLIIDPEDIKSAKRLSDIMVQLRALWDAILIKVGAAFIPLLEAGANALEKHFIPAMKVVEEVTERIEQAFRRLVEEPGKLGEAFQSTLNYLKEQLTLIGADFVIALAKGMAAALRQGEENAPWWMKDTYASAAQAADSVQGKAMDARRDILQQQLERVRRGERADGLPDIFALPDERGPAIPIEEQRRLLRERNSGIQGALDESRSRFTDKSFINELSERLATTQVDALQQTPKLSDSLSAGTFSGRAAGFMGETDNPMTRELSEANKHLKRIERNTQGETLTFG